MDLAKLWAVEAATVIGLILVVRALLQVAIALFNGALVQFRWIVDLRQYSILVSSISPGSAIYCLSLADGWYFETLLSGQTSDSR
jgi:hypothetical protein